MNRAGGVLQNAVDSPSAIIGLATNAKTDGARLNKVIAAIKRCGFFPADYVYANPFKAAIAVVLVNNYLAPSSSFWGLCAGNQRAFWSTLIPTLRRWASPYLIVGDSHAGL